MVLVFVVVVVVVFFTFRDILSFSKPWTFSIQPL